MRSFLRSSELRSRGLCLGLILASFTLRIHALLQLPGYVDEGLHLRWASEIWQGHLIYPFATAKPLEIYYLAALLPFQNPLWVGRVGSVLTDVVILSAIWALARQLGNERAGWWAVMLYALSPWTFFHERLAIADSLTAASGAVLAWTAVVWSKRPSPRRALGLTICLIALPLTKLSAAPLTLIPLVAAWRGKSSWRQIILPYLVAAASLSVIFGLISLRYEVCALCADIALRPEASESVTWSASILNNVNDLVDWAGVYLGFAGPLMLIGAVVAGIRRQRLGLAALAGFLLGSASLIAPAQSFPRYYLAALVFGSLLAAEAVEFLLGLTKKPLIRWGIGALVLVGAGAPFALFADQAYRDPGRLKLADIDSIQHVSDWPSGYAIHETAAYLANQLAQDKKPAVVYVANQATLAVAWLYWPPTEAIYLLWDFRAPDVITTVASGRPVYLIVDTQRDKADFRGLTINPHELVRFYRPLGGKPVIAYRLLAEPFTSPEP